MKKAVIYLRVSTDEQVKGLSLDNQLLACQQWAANNGITVQEIFRDEGTSAKTLNRPAMQRMLKYLDDHKGEIGYVVTYQTDRLTRKAADFYFLRSRLRKIGVEYKNTNSSLKEDATEVLVTGLQAVLSEYDNVLKADRTRDNMRRHTAEGHRMHKAPYGLRNVRDLTGRPTLEPIPGTAEILRELLTEFSRGILNIKELLTMAHENGLVRSNGQPMTYQLLGKALRNPIYAGYEQSKLTDGKLTKSSFDGIITLQTFYKNQHLLEKHKNHKVHGYVINNPLFPLRRFVTCSSCGAPLRGSSPKNKSGTAYPKYHCSTKGCGQPSIDNQDLHEKFGELLKGVELSEPAQKLYKTLILRAWNEEIKQIQHRKRRFENKIRELENDKHKVFDKFIKDEITLQDKNDFYNRADIEIEQLRSNISMLSEKAGNRQEVVDHGIGFLGDASRLLGKSQCRHTDETAKLNVPGRNKL